MTFYCVRGLFKIFVACKIVMKWDKNEATNFLKLLQ